MSKKIQNRIKLKSKTHNGRDFVNKKISKSNVELKNNSLLYRFVYSSTISVMVVLLLMASFFIQGIQEVYASEEIVSSEITSITVEQTSTDSEIIVPTPNEVIKPETHAVSDLIVLDTIEVTDIVDSEVVEVNTNDALVGEIVLPVADNNNDVDESIISDQSDIIDDPLVTDQSESTSSVEMKDINIVEVSNVTNTSTTFDLVKQDVPSLTTKEEVVIDDSLLDDTEVITTHESVSVSNSDSVFTFNKDECTQLANGSFYCLKPQENQLQDALFSAPDQGGDLEIFLVRGGVQTQVTDNNMDDSAPYFDQNTNTIVWHRLINDRYQIISYDIDTQVETQVTNTPKNNMEPTRQGKYTVWQRWVDGGWNIILFDGNIESQITHSNNNNIAPYVHGDLVVWNMHDQNGDKTIEMYDIKSGTYVTVDDPEGMSVANPRMVFVYDSLYPNGDIVTKGYDILAKKFIQLDTLPRDLPDEIPPADSTGETRALIQSKPGVKSSDLLNLSSTTPKADVPNLDPDTKNTISATLNVDETNLDTASTSIPVEEISNSLLNNDELSISSTTVLENVVQDIVIDENSITEYDVETSTTTEEIMQIEEFILDSVQE